MRWEVVQHARQAASTLCKNGVGDTASTPQIQLMEVVDIVSIYIDFRPLSFLNLDYCKNIRFYSFKCFIDNSVLGRTLIHRLKKAEKSFDPSTRTAGLAFLVKRIEVKGE